VTSKPKFIEQTKQKPFSRKKNQIKQS